MINHSLASFSQDGSGINNRKERACGWASEWIGLLSSPLQKWSMSLSIAESVSRAAQRSLVVLRSEHKCGGAVRIEVVYVLE